MKKSIGKRVLALVFGPFVLILVLLSAYISYTILQTIVGWTELELKGITEINAAQLAGRIDSVRITVLTAAKTLERIDGKTSDARDIADEAVRNMFTNESVYNSWIIYEPNAFDGRDARHTEDYPGAPSGRFMRSYVMEDGEIIVAPDMEEGEVDDLSEAPWYVIPRDEQRLYIDVANPYENLYDYGVGEAPVYTLSVSAPLYRDGTVIGCVGADVVFDTMTFGIGDAKNAAVAVFYPDGRVFYAEDIHFAEDSADTLGFWDAGRIKQAISSGEALFMPDDFCPFLGERAFMYFNPVYSEGMDENGLCLYVALQRDRVLSALFPMLTPVVISAVLFLVAFCFLYIYASGKIFKPVRRLTMAADAISQGDLQADVTVFSKAEDEIGTLSRSLHRMVEQFRVYIFQQDQIREETELRSLLYLAADAGDAPSAYAVMTNLLRGHFNVRRLTFVLFNAGKASIAAISTATDSKAIEPIDFIHHSQVMGLLEPYRKLVFLNSNAILMHKLSFVGEDAVSVCVVPIRSEQSLNGYFIVENDNLNSTFRAGSESALLFIARKLPDWLAGIRQREGQQKASDTGKAKPAAEETEGQKPEVQPVRENPGGGRIEELRHVNGLNVDTALEAMGGLTEIYERSVRLFTRTAPESIAKMDAFLDTGNMASFAIEIHGIKGALNNIGAMALGELAAQLERGAKEEGAEPAGSAEKYSEFKEQTAKLLEELTELTSESAETQTKPSGSVTELKKALTELEQAAERYDSLEALDILTRLMEYDYGKETNERLQELNGLLELFEYEKSAEIITALGGMTDDTENI